MGPNQMGPPKKLNLHKLFDKSYESNSNSSNSSAGSGKRANRTRFTDYQIKVLQEFFENNSYPKDSDLEYLSKLLLLSPRVIVVWFQVNKLFLFTFLLLPFLTVLYVNSGVHYGIMLGPNFLHFENKNKNPKIFSSFPPPRRMLVKSSAKSTRISRTMRYTSLKRRRPAPSITPAKSVSWCSRDTMS